METLLIILKIVFGGIFIIALPWLFVFSYFYFTGKADSSGNKYMRKVYILIAIICLIAAAAGGGGSDHFWR